MKRTGAALIALLAATAIALTGCGQSHAQRQANTRTCWTKQTHSEMVRLDGSDRQLAKAQQDLIVTSVNAYAAGAHLPSWLPGYIKPWLHATEQKCGKLA